MTFQKTDPPVWLCRAHASPASGSEGSRAGPAPQPGARCCLLWSVSFRLVSISNSRNSLYCTNARVRFCKLRSRGQRGATSPSCRRAVAVGASVPVSRGAGRGRPPPPAERGTHGCRPPSRGLLSAASRMFSVVTESNSNYSNEEQGLLEESEGG